MFQVSGRMPCVAAHGGSGWAIGLSSPPAAGVLSRLVDRRLTPQRRHGSTIGGRRRDVRPASGSIGRGSPSGPDLRRGRRRARLRLVPALALLFGALSPFAAAPASADVLVSNIGQEQRNVTLALAGNAYAQGFTTGTHAAGYNLESIEAVFRRRGDQELPAGYVSTIRAELWSDNNWEPASKLADLTVPTNFAPGTVAFAAPTGTLLAANARYFLVIYTTGDLDALGVGRAGNANEDAGAADGWYIFASGRYAASNTPGGTWPRHPDGILSIRVNGAEATRTTASEVTLSALPDYVARESAGKVTVVATLDKPAPEGGVTVTFKAGPGTHLATPDDDYRLPGSFTIEAGATSARADVTIVDDKIDEEAVEFLYLTADAGGLVINDLTIWIQDDDTAGLRLIKNHLGLRLGAIMVTDAADYTVEIATRPTADVTIAATSSAETKATVDPASVTFTPDDWEDPKTFTVTGVGIGASTISHAVTTEDGKYSGLSVDPVSFDVRASNRTYTIRSLGPAKEGGMPVVLMVQLGRPAPEGGVSFAVSYDYSGGSAAADTDAAPSTFTVPQNQPQDLLIVYPAVDDLVEGEETFEVTVTATTAGWTVASDGSASATATIEDQDYEATIAFGDNAAATATYAATVKEDVSGGTLHVPVTVSHLPGASTTFAVEVVEGGSATEYTDTSNPGDYRIATKSVSFGPSDTSRTQNLAIAITNDDDQEWLETIELRIAAADATAGDPGDLYGRDANSSKATITIDSEDPALSEDSEGSEDLPVAAATRADPLTASFERVPSEHDGEESFWFNVRFSDALGAENYWHAQGEWPEAASFDVRGGKVKRVRRLEPDLWKVRIVPKSWRDVTVTLADGRGCDEKGAVCTPDGRALSNTATATVGGPVRIRIEGARAREGKDASLDFAVTLNRAASAEVSVDYATADGTATAGADYTAVSGTLTFAPGETAKTVSVAILDDAVDEGRERFKLLLSNPRGAYLRGMHREATGIIINEDPLPQAWLGRFGRTVASDAVAAVTARLETPRAAGSHLTVAGQRLDLARAGDARALTDALTGLARAFGAPGAPAAGDDDPFARRGLSDPWDDPAATAAARRVTAGELLMGTSFRAVLGQGAGTQLTTWGQSVSVSQFSSAVPGLSLSGEAATGSLGMDYERGRVLAGFAMLHSLGDGTARGANQSYALGTAVTTVLPFARLRLTERISAWGLAGTGTGRLTLDVDGGLSQRYRTDLALTLAAVGVRGDLVTPAGPGGFVLALKADAFQVRTESAAVRAPGVGNLAASRADASRLRAVLDGSRTFVLAGGRALTPSLEFGVRHDGGDEGVGTGMELGAGLGYADPSRGLDAALRVHGLAAHAGDDRSEWGVSGSLRLAPGDAGRGLSMSLTPSWGAAPQGAERLWAMPDASALAAHDEADPSSRLDVEVGYGTAVSGGFTGTPNVGFGLTDAARTWRMGWRLTPPPGAGGFELNLDAISREAADDGDAEHGAMLKGLIRW